MQGIDRNRRRTNEDVLRTKLQDARGLLLVLACVAAGCDNRKPDANQTRGLDNWLLATPGEKAARVIAPIKSAAAEEALNKGIIAAKLPNYLLAIRFFEDARILAPEAPVIYYNLGLAESKIPGRELRAISWFGAYLAANPTAPNAAAVKEQMDVLHLKSQSNLLRLIKLVGDSANQMSGDNSYSLSGVAALWAKAGDIVGALKTTGLIQAALSKIIAQIAIAEAQAKSGDAAGAQKTLGFALKTADLIERADQKSLAQQAIVESQAESGDIAGAQKTADLIQRASFKSWAQIAIAEAQMKIGDIVGAQNTLASAIGTADLIQDANSKSKAQAAIAEAQAKASIANAPNSARQSTSDTQPQIQPVITVSDWLKKLDDSDKTDDCSLNTEPFLDLAGYLKSLPPSDDPQTVFKGLRETAEKIVKAQNVVHEMLKQQTALSIRAERIREAAVAWRGRVETELPEVTARLAKFAADSGLTLVPIPAGEFLMGSPEVGTGPFDSDEGPQTRVTISRPFFLGAMEVTQAQWTAVMGSNPSHFKGDTLPVESVSWEDAMAFCNRLNERERATGRLPAAWEFTLPTEAQWEYACRAGTTGDYAGNLDAMAWYRDAKSGRGQTHPVGQKQPNTWGLYDMHGNVSEWCLDWYGSYPGGNVSDPTGAGPDSHFRGLVFRGCSWADSARICRSAWRYVGSSTDRLKSVGVRLTLSSGR